VNWTSEKECFATFLRELAYFHVPGPILPVESPTKDADGEGSSSVIGEHELKTERWQIQHVLFPALKKYFVAPKDLLDRDVVQIANLPDLYRVFERC
jgi:DNA mismatch repair protein MLH1